MIKATVKNIKSEEIKMPITIMKIIVTTVIMTIIIIMIIMINKICNRMKI